MVVNNKDKCAEYNKVGINTSNQEMLILKCYNGVINCLKKSIELIPDRKQWPEVNKNMITAQKGLALLADAINPEVGEVAENLLKLYDFMISYLVKANMKKDAKMTEDVLKMLVDMKESWEKAFKKLHQEADSNKPLNHNQGRPQQQTQGVLNIVG